ncbi:MAG: hypothetical protein AAGA48_02480 [Myxococcota bacterium]
MKQVVQVALAVLTLVIVANVSVQLAVAQSPSAPSYCMMTAYRATAVAKNTKLILDCGESGPTGQRLVDDVTGKSAKFRSSIDALNYMASQGFEDRGGYVLNADSGNPTYVWLLRKE